jgi:hypothetical protein
MSAFALSIRSTYPSQCPLSGGNGARRFVTWLKKLAISDSRAYIGVIIGFPLRLPVAERHACAPALKGERRESNSSSTIFCREPNSEPVSASRASAVGLQ